jgi:hypothetical protein
MNPDAIRTQLNRLELETAAIIKRRKRRAAQYQAEEKRMDAIRHERHRLQLAVLLGVPDAVRVRFRVRSTDRWAWLNDQPGTIRAIRRTRCLVVFADKEVDIALEALNPADDLQGYHFDALVDQAAKQAHQVTNTE